MLSRVAENYLRIIYQTIEKKGSVRPSDIARTLDVSAPTVTEMLQKLSKEGLINYEKREAITLTEKGFINANGIMQKYQVFLKLFKMAGVSNTTAYLDACFVEHYVSQETVNHLVQFVDRLEKTQICKKS